MARTHRRAAKVDNNQTEIVRQLRSIPGVSVTVGHDDILVGWRGKTFWYELKSKGKRRRLQPSQVDLNTAWTGHYRVVESLSEILLDMGVTRRHDIPYDGFNISGNADGGGGSV